MIQTICITRRDQEDLLLKELHSSRPGVQCTHVAPQVVEISSKSDQDLAISPLFFSTQLLPHAERIYAPSINQWAQAIFETLIKELGDYTLPWSLHIFDPLTAETGESYARPDRVRESLLDLLKQKRRSLLKNLSENTRRDTLLVQIAMTSPTEGYLSVATPGLRDLFRAAIADEVAGFVNITDDKAPPSRAFKKLREAISTFELHISKSDSAVDLGASPGGWTHVLRECGAKVTAVDRSPLSPNLMRDRGVTFVKGNALSWCPEKQVDWLVCDVITSPENTLAILKLWIGKKLCRNFCVTVKFKGDPAFHTLREICAFLTSHTSWYDGRQLTQNKNEVTVVGSVGE